MSPRFSVVIPLYNKEKHISCTISSVLAQSFQDFKIVIVDDGSTDGSVDAVNLVKDDRVKVISQINAGVSVARNRGVEESNGDYIAFLDADDEWLPCHLEELDKLIKEFPGCGIYSVAHFTMQEGIKYYPSTGVSKEFRGIVDNVFDTFGKGLALVNSSTACVHRPAFIKSGGFPIGIKCGEDVYVWLKMAFANRMAHSAKVTALYNKDATNRSNVTAGIEIPYYFFYLEKLRISKGLASEYKQSIERLLVKGIVFTSAGYCLDNNKDALKEVIKLQIVKEMLFLRFLLFILRMTPIWVLVIIRSRRHAKIG